MQQTEKIISSYDVLPYLSYWRETGRISSKSFLLLRRGYFFDREDSFPLEEGRTAGSYSTFFREFLRISKGLRSFVLN